MVNQRQSNTARQMQWQLQHRIKKHIPQTNTTRQMQGQLQQKQTTYTQTNTAHQMQGQLQQIQTTYTQTNTARQMQGQLQQTQTTYTQRPTRPVKCRDSYNRNKQHIHTDQHGPSNAGTATTETNNIYTQTNTARQMQGQLQQKQTTYTHRPTRPVKCRDSYNRNKQHIHKDQHGPSNAGTATTETNNIYTQTNTARQMQGQLQQKETTYTHRPTRPIKCRDSYNRYKQHIHTDQHSPSNAGTATTETNNIYTQTNTARQMQGQLQQKQTTYTHRPTRPVKWRDSYNRNKQHIHTDQHGPSNAGTATTETNNIYTQTNTARQMQGQLQQKQTANAIMTTVRHQRHIEHFTYYTLHIKYSFPKKDNWNNRLICDANRDKILYERWDNISQSYTNC